MTAAPLPPALPPAPPAASARRGPSDLGSDLGGTSAWAEAAGASVGASVGLGAGARSFPERTTLTAKDRVVLRAIAEAMFSQDGEVATAHLDAHLDEIDAFVSAASKPLRAGLRLALVVVRLAPLLFFFRMRTLERLSVDERVPLLARLERSRIANLSLAFIGWRSIMTLVFYESPAELAKLGYASERKVYKRRLAVLAPAHEHAPGLAVAHAHAPAIAESEPRVTAVPAPEDSGVRLRDHDARDSEPPAAVPANGSREVA